MGLDGAQLGRAGRLLQLLSERERERATAGLSGFPRSLRRGPFRDSERADSARSRGGVWRKLLAYDSLLRHTAASGYGYYRVWWSRREDADHRQTLQYNSQSKDPHLRIRTLESSEGRIGLRDGCIRRQSEGVPAGPPCSRHSSCSPCPARGESAGGRGGRVLRAGRCSPMVIPASEYLQESRARNQRLTSVRTSKGFFATPIQRSTHAFFLDPN